MKPIIRPATKEDLPILDKFMDGLVDAERPMDVTIKDGKVVYYNLEDFINSDKAVLYVVELNNELVASGYAKIKQDRVYLKHDQHAYLGFMFVPEKHRGNGYNKLIVDALLEWSKSKNITEIRLDVYNSNPSAIRAYEKAGFKKHLINMRMDISDLEN
jgi:RimJ/RimL family protein N-acetyltransferase